MRRFAIGNIEETAWSRLGSERLSVSVGDDIPYAENQLLPVIMLPPSMAARNRHSGSGLR